MARPARPSSFVAFLLAALLTGAARVDAASPQSPSEPAVPRRAGAPPSVDELLALNIAGFAPEEFLRLLDQSGDPSLTDDDLARLEQAPLPPAVMTRLRAVAAKNAPKALTFEELRALLAAGVGDEQLLSVLKTARAPLATGDQILELLRSGASTAVLRAVREKSVETPASRPVARLSGPALDDLARLVERETSGDALVKRIEASDVRYEVDAVKLVELSRAGVPPEVLKSVWARRRGAGPAAELVPRAAEEAVAEAAGMKAGAAMDARAKLGANDAATPPVAAAETAVALAAHEEAVAGYTLLAPEGFSVRRDARNGNSLLSFVKGEPAQADGIAEAELAVFTYRSAAPERLVEANLGPVGENFLMRLSASYSARKIATTFGPREPARLAGRAAMKVRLAATGVEGTTHAGELWWLFVGDRTFVLSTAVRSDMTTLCAEPLAKCLRSFAPLEKKERPVGGSDRGARAANSAETWRSAVLNRDFALFETLYRSPGRTTARMDAFTTLADRFADPETRLVLGPVDTFKSGAVTEFKLLGGPTPQTTTVRWTLAGDVFLLEE